MAPKTLFALIALATLSKASAPETVPGCNASLGQVPTMKAHVAQELAAPSATTEPSAPPPAAPTGTVRAGNMGLGIVFVPSEIAAGDGSTDLLIHLHGETRTVVPAVEAAGLRSTVLVINRGLSSGAYESAFSGAGAFQRVLDATAQWLDKRGLLTNAKIGRVALSCWSAGCGAVGRILSDTSAADRIDAVLVADGMHAPFGLDHRSVEPRSVRGYVGYGKRAMAGDKLFVVTHSQVEAYGYASTTAAASFVSNALGLEASKVEEPGPRAMMRISRREAGSMFVHGYAGTTAGSHSDHLLGMGGTTLPMLKARWEKP